MEFFKKVFNRTWLRMKRQMVKRNHDKILEPFLRLQGESHNIATELGNITAILKKENGRQVYISFFDFVRILVAVSMEKDRRIESRIYMPSFTDSPIGHTIFIKDEKKRAYDIREISINSRFHDMKLGSELLRRTLQAIDPDLNQYVVTGADFVSSVNVPLVKHFFEKFQFVVQEQHGIVFVRRSSY